MGKPHAMWSASNHATGDWLLFTDADVMFKPDALRRAVTYAEAEPADATVAAAPAAGPARILAEAGGFDAHRVELLDRLDGLERGHVALGPRADGVAAVAAVKAAGGTVVAREYTNDKATDFKAILTKIKAKSPDVVMYGGMDAQGGPMVKQMKELGIKAKFIAGDGVCSAEWPKLAGGAAEGHFADLGEPVQRARARDAQGDDDAGEEDALHLGSGVATETICSSMTAAAFSWSPSSRWL